MFDRQVLYFYSAHVLIFLALLVPAETNAFMLDENKNSLGFRLKAVFAHDFSGRDDAFRIFHIADVDLVSLQHPLKSGDVNTKSHPRSSPILTVNTQLKQSYGMRKMQTTPGVTVDLIAEQQSRVVPNVSDKDTIVNLAIMTSDAYVLDASQPDWLNLTQGYNNSMSFGWDSDGLRGHVFANEDDSIIVVAFKGTTILPGDPNRINDKLNDNRLFSCCCGSQTTYSYIYPPVCSCAEGVYQCNSTCVTASILEPNLYYATALSVMNNITREYPSSAFWTVGHSLGGAIASLTGLTFNIPAVAFESPPDYLAAGRMRLLRPREDNQLMPHHFGNTADPVFMGACNGFFASCAASGFFFESQCFTGQTHIYDTVGDKGWHSSITNHRINNVIDNVLKVYDEVPEGEEDDECVDCYNWKYD